MFCESLPKETYQPFDRTLRYMQQQRTNRSEIRLLSLIRCPSANPRDSIQHTSQYWLLKGEWVTPQMKLDE